MTTVLNPFEITAPKSPSIDAALRLYLERKTRADHPRGTFDNGQRWYPSADEEQPCCSMIRTPSRHYPYSLMVHCRTAEHIAALCDVPLRELRQAIRRAVPRSTERRIWYKIVQVAADGTYHSLWAPEIVYTIGKTYAQAAKPDHGGGYYVHPLPIHLRENFLSGYVCGDPIRGNTYAILECLCWGSRQTYSNGKEAWGHLKPLSEHERFMVQA